MNKDEWKEEDLEIWKEEDSETINPTKFDSKDNQLRVIRTNQDYNLDYLRSSIGKNIILGPHYQRRSRWSANQKSLLIESFLLNIPIPPIYLYEKDYHVYEVVDGRQRLEAIRDFLADGFKLKNMEYYTHLNDTKFSDFPEEEQRLLLRRSISATILLAESKGFDELDVRMLLFDRLNTGGVKLNAQELRNAIFSGKFNDLLDRLSSFPNYRSLWNIPIPVGNDSQLSRLEKNLANNPIFKSMMDCELVLRTIGIREVYSENINEGSMKYILDSTMKIYEDISDTESMRIENEFKEAIDFIYDTFGNDAIKNPILTPPQRARNIYDALVVSYWQVDDKSKIKNSEVIKNNLLTTLKDTENYDKIITKGNSIENIKFRIDKFIEILTLDSVI